MIRRLLAYLRPYLRRISALLLVSLVLSLLNVAEPALMGRLTAAIFSNERGLRLGSGEGGGRVRRLELLFEKESGFAPSEAAALRDLCRQGLGRDARFDWRETPGLIRLTVLNVSSQAAASANLAELARRAEAVAPGIAVYPRVEPASAGGWVLFPQIRAVYLLPAMILLVMLIRIFFFFGQTYLGTYVTTGAIRDVRNQLHAHIQRLSLGFFERQQTGHLMSRITSDAATLQSFLHMVSVEMLGDFFTVVAGVAYAFALDWSLALVTIATMSLIALPMSMIGRALRAVGRSIQARWADLAGVLQESISAVRVIKAFQMEDLSARKFNHHSEQVFRAGMRNARLIGFLTPFIEFLAGCVLAVFIWYGAYRMGIGLLAPDELFTFVFVVGYIANPVKHLSKKFGQVQHALAAGERITAILDEKPQIEEAPNAVILPAIAGEVRFERVSFSYGDGPLVLKDIDLSVSPGEIIALVGPSGAGKTSLVNLLPRFYDPVAGRVLIDGHDLRTVKIESLRAQLGIVPQETLLFRASVAENIGYGRPGASRAEIEHAARMANAHNFITALPDGYETLVGERGQTLSGGQRQRIAIARALLRDPRLLILDEATSSLDAASEALVQEALERLMQGRTTFVIAHRLSTVRRAHRLAVIVQGRLAELGTHDELLARGGEYARLYEQQFRGMDK